MTDAHFKANMDVLVGKKITAVVTTEANRTTPRHQILLVFEDETYLEIYGNDFQVSRGLRPGGLKAAREYAAALGALAGVVNEFGSAGESKDC